MLDFVLNLLITPGGIDSLGGDGGTYRSVALIAAGHFLSQALMWPLSGWIAKTTTMRLKWRQALVVLLVAMAGERVMFGLADLSCRLSAARMMTYEAAKLYDAGQDISVIAAQAKLLASETSHDVVDTALSDLQAGRGISVPGVAYRAVRVAMQMTPRRIYMPLSGALIKRFT